MRTATIASVLASLLLAACGVAAGAAGLDSPDAPQVKVAAGTLQGLVAPIGIREFLGIPYAQPPVGSLRWREPQPALPWRGARMATRFGLRPMQLHPFPDQLFRSPGMSEDCLYLNVWTPAKSDSAHLPVLVYIYGGGFVTGSGDEQRYDGASLAAKGIVVVTMNYRLGVLGFMALPALTAESPHHASGNYGLLDQVAALKWVHDNISRLGGDPKRVTLGGESAGSFSVSALMASPLSKPLFSQASGESGSVLDVTPPLSLADAEKQGTTFAASIHAPTLAALRAMPADQLLQAADDNVADPDARPLVDHYFLAESPVAAYEAGRQAHVPLLAGWNSAEGDYPSIFHDARPSPVALSAAITDLYGDSASPVRSAYAASTPAEAAQAARDLASDRFIAYGTWNWIDVQARTGGKPVYRYFYAHPLPPRAPEYGGPALNDSGRPAAASAPSPIIPPGAPHASDIAYFLGNIGHYDYFAWQPADYTTSAAMETYFADFIKTGTPNSGAAGLPNWSSLQTQPPMIMRLDVHPQAVPEQHQDRYAALKAISQQQH